MPSSASAKLIIIDDHPAVTESITLRLLDAGFAVLPPLTGVDGIDWALAPDVAICDLRLLPGLSWGGAIRHLVGHGCRVLAMSGVATPEQVLDAIEQGAQGFVEKTSMPAEFVSAVNAVVEGHHHVSARLAGYILEDVRRRPLADGELGPEEIAVIRAFAQGDSVSEVALTLGVAERDVHALVARVFDVVRRRRRDRRYRLTERELQIVRLVGHLGLTRHDAARALRLSDDRVSDLLGSVRDKYLACHPDESRNLAPLSAAIRWANELGIF
ncbi:response regulator transcription factor [Nonomuraea sp. NPDC000554]|uniref:response regulator transcription factor n=1 Tax=Nonomuraea sp. NPDC000554 TaxID=3154259 RepID=UPI00332F77EB